MGPCLAAGKNSQLKQRDRVKTITSQEGKEGKCSSGERKLSAKLSGRHSSGPGQATWTFMGGFCPPSGCDGANQPLFELFSPCVGFSGCHGNRQLS